MMQGTWEVETTEITVVPSGKRGAESPTWVVFYLLITTLWTLILVSIPVMTEVGPDNYYANHPGWYTGDDVIRFIEPIGGLMLNFLIFHKSGILRKELTPAEVLCVVTFVFGGAMYVQGAGFHSASAMYKNSLKQAVTDDGPTYDPLYYYMRTVWEHGVSHYIYASGYALMQAAQLWAYRDTRYAAEAVTLTTKVLLVCSGSLLGLLLLGVALQFPSGTIVGFIYLTLYGMVTVGGYHLYLYSIKAERQALTALGYLAVPHHFLAGYVLSYAGLILWIIVAGGFHSRSEE